MHQYLVWPPLAFNTASTLLGILSIKFWHTSAGVLSHSASTFSHNSNIPLGVSCCDTLTIHPGLYHTFHSPLILGRAHHQSIPRPNSRPHGGVYLRITPPSPWPLYTHWDETRRPLEGRVATAYVIHSIIPWRDLQQGHEQYRETRWAWVWGQREIAETRYPHTHTPVSLVWQRMRWRHSLHTSHNSKGPLFICAYIYFNMPHSKTRLTSSPFTHI